MRIRKLLKAKLRSRNLIKEMSTKATISSEILGYLLTMDKGWTERNGPEDKFMTMYKYICQKKKEEESSTLK